MGDTDTIFADFTAKDVIEAVTAKEEATESVEEYLDLSGIYGEVMRNLLDVDPNETDLSI